MKIKMKRNVIIGKKNNQNLIHVILCLKFLTQVHNNNKNDTIIIKATFHIVWIYILFVSFSISEWVNPDCQAYINTGIWTLL